MKFKSLTIGEKEYYKPKIITKLLYENGFYWLIDSEFIDAEIEIKNETMIWHSGTFLYGKWKYGIWLNGDFRDGIWENGIWENGNFNGKFLSGIFKDGTISDEAEVVNITKK